MIFFSFSASAGLAGFPLPSLATIRPWKGHFTLSIRGHSCPVGKGALQVHFTGTNFPENSIFLELYKSSKPYKPKPLTYQQLIIIISRENLDAAIFGMQRKLYNILYMIYIMRSALVLSL